MTVITFCIIPNANWGVNLWQRYALYASPGHSSNGFYFYHFYFYLFDVYHFYFYYFSTVWNPKSPFFLHTFSPKKYVWKRMHFSFFETVKLNWHFIIFPNCRKGGGFSSYKFLRYPTSGSVLIRDYKLGRAHFPGLAYMNRRVFRCFRELWKRVLFPYLHRAELVYFP